MVKAWAIEIKGRGSLLLCANIADVCGPSIKQSSFLIDAA